ncbi:NAD-dependent epimerase/dehydratase family protein [Mesotoga sp. BH458_6_3_2_1]|uniref:NAD-dependent epimerase/dehydratase family protein n=1 Tax=Mesotoga sp. BH458_6_3_2_1 TaxID=1437446 RepID=UPI000EF1C472|nr:NAD-dependent epimerase/dehydratase family protein [Mesotoga sp. BH458_6_3_2_1]RLL85925.1 epimerase [Mesotoga sp. BH458_6_3_2_1]
MNKVLVTGGSGFIGSHLCERLLKEGYFVINLDNFNNYYDPRIKWRNIQEALKNQNYALYVGDIRDTKVLDQISEEQEKIDEVVHLAAMAGVRNSLKDPVEYVSVDIGGTVNMLEFARRNEVEKFVFASSSSVYGKNSKVPFSEDDPLEGQVSPYATAKRAGELYCQTYSEIYNIPIVALRFFTVYGPRQRPEMAIHLFTRLIMEGKPIPVFGDGSTARDYTYIDDIIEGVYKAMLYDKTSFEIFNLGNSKTVKLSELIRIIEKAVRKEAIVDRKPTQLGDVEITIADIGKGNALLSYRPRTKIHKGVSFFSEWFDSF